MNIPSITDLAKMTARFDRFEDGKLYYAIDIGGLGTLFEFPIRVFDVSKGGPANDVGGVFLAEMKGITLIRWIRKHLEMIHEAREAHEEEVSATD